MAQVYNIDLPMIQSVWRVTTQPTSPPMCLLIGDKKRKIIIPTYGQTHTN